MDHILLNIILILAIITCIKYLLYVFTSPLYVFSRIKALKPSKGYTKHQIEQLIRVSVIVPAWNESVGILTAVTSLLKSSYKNLEIIVVNDGSTDDTDALMSKYMETFDSNKHGGKLVKYFSKSNGGKGSALNHGIKNSTGNLIVTMDADTIFEHNAIYNVTKYFINPDIDAAVGNVKVANSKSLLGLIQQIEYTIGFYFKRTHAVFNSEYIIGGAFGVFRKNVFEKYGYFDEINKTEDIEFSTRLQLHGCNIVYIEESIAYTEGPDTLSGLMKQRLRWKKGRLDTFLKYRNLFFSKHPKHRKFLTHFLLPITVFYEIELLFEPLFTFFGLFHIHTSGDYRPLEIWILFTVSIFMITFLFGSEKNSIKAFLFTPLYFLLSYVLTFVEVYAMYESLRMLIYKKEITWQKWARKGISEV